MRLFFISVDLSYSPELCRALQTFVLPDCQADEQALCQQFDQPDQNRKWREGIIKSSFNYLLLDPRFAVSHVTSQFSLLSSCKVFPAPKEKLMLTASKFASKKLKIQEKLWLKWKQCLCSDTY